MPKVGQNLLDKNKLAGAIITLLLGISGWFAIEGYHNLMKRLDAIESQARVEFSTIKDRQRTSDSTIWIMAKVQADQAETIREQAKEIKELRGR